jgi:ribosomal protein L37AE/L43A
MRFCAGNWRPCCGDCRSERLVERDERGEHSLRCTDCGAVWDGSQLTPAEVRDRPAPRKPPAGTLAFAP